METDSERALFSHRDLNATPRNKATTNEKNIPLITSFDKGLRILNLIVDADLPLRLQDIADSIGIDKSSAYRFMATLEKHALVERSALTKTYSIGMRLQMWSKNLKAGNAIVEHIRPYLKKLAQLTQQTSHLAVLRDDRVVLIEVMPSEGLISVRQTVGDWEPLYCSAVGKAILAFLPMIEQRRLIEQMNFREFTETTISSVEMLRSELRSVVHEKVAFDEGENNPLVSCIAAPVMDRFRYPVVSMGISMARALRQGSPRSHKDLVAAVRDVAADATASFLRA